jgi:hypothetical protein
LTFVKMEIDENPLTPAKYEVEVTSIARSTWTGMAR